MQYADDLVLLATSKDELQVAINDLATYCISNKLVINLEKTKVLVMGNGRLPDEDFEMNECIIFAGRAGGEMRVDCLCAPGYLYDLAKYTSTY